MRSLGLKNKILFISFIPILIGLVISTIIGVRNYRVYFELKDLAKKMTATLDASNLVHLTQIERGMSASFLNGGATLSSLKSHWKKNDKLKDTFLKSLNNSPFDRKTIEEINLLYNEAFNLRKNIASKSVKTKNVLKKYTTLIKRLLDIQLELSKKSSITDIAIALRTIRVLEASKEAGGKLRAHLSSALAKDGPLDQKKYSLLFNLFSTMEQNLRSKSLKVSVESQKDLLKVFEQKEWKNIRGVLFKTLQNYREGNFQTDPVKFFSTITVVLDGINKLISTEKNYMMSLIDKNSTRALRNFILVSISSLFLCLSVMITMWIVLKKIIFKLTNVVEEIQDQSTKLSQSSKGLTEISLQLSDSTNSQASYLQETVSSIDEISSMVQRNADASASSKIASEKSNKVTLEAKKLVESMLESIKDIAGSTDNIAFQMEKNSEDISKILNVISKIGEKTQVINDIVFQTKLLSFNASVEAARAGEHGKGFAVVAEEVGNLAAMSGKAALEITEMLNNSIKSVTEIMNESKTKVESLAKNSRDKVSSGTSKAQSCVNALEEISASSISVNDMIREIAQASSEQSIGVQEVTKAMRDLDTTTHKNANSSLVVSNTSQKLSSFSDGLSHAVTEITSILSGKKKTSKTKAKKDHNNNNNSRPLASLDRKKAA